MTITTKVDIYIDGKSVSLRLAPAIWQAFQTMANAENATLGVMAKRARAYSNEGTLAEAITAFVQRHATVPLYATRELWCGALVDAMRPVFEERGYPLPEKIRASIAFTSTGWKGKTRGECWNSDMSADGATEIMVCLRETDPVRIVNILVHELCHAAQFKRAKDTNKPIKKKAGHGKTFAVVAQALDLNPAINDKGQIKWDYALGDADGKWGEWAKPIIEAAGPMPHAAIAEFVKKQTEDGKQTTRMLKLEHDGCEFSDEGKPVIWRMSSKHIADKPSLRCPCCGTSVENPHFEGEGDAEDGIDPDTAAEEIIRETDEDGHVVQEIGRRLQKKLSERKAARNKPRYEMTNEERNEADNARRTREHQEQQRHLEHQRAGRKSAVQELLDGAAAVAARQTETTAKGHPVDRRKGR